MPKKKVDPWGIEDSTKTFRGLNDQWRLKYRLQIKKDLRGLKDLKGGTKKPAPKFFGTGFFVGLVVWFIRSC